MKSILLSCLVLVIMACSSSKSNPSARNADATVADDYGYSETNPIKVGGVNSGPANERRYLERLTGPNGEPIAYVRLGSCCPFETKNSAWGGMLDRYEIVIDGDPEKKILYLNMYDSDKLYAPKGFKLDGK
ncbi:2-dehydro-3-deoxyphosphooctonate aldolase [Flavobacterium sp. MFBS3-15]|uniref:2-dehydro-3-deoxyphosphooctonate aldolase n=1 Tax=Flavobacterium sp. MFBS3-15 TaxID=2989816 RepID=UPI0022364E63|nr:2-dehydro-3-deoxyphosphooctonate aldolase [Flavobacterium sp. MFBS3-15]MCW4469595.1 2-dehydro-3-deoxyphosphooctonate aldolase [Flavobacterium sp. MFBS3-15]